MGTDAVGACEYVGDAELGTHVTPDKLCSSVMRAHGVAEKDKKYEKD